MKILTTILFSGCLTLSVSAGAIGDTPDPKEEAAVINTALTSAKIVKGSPYYSPQVPVKLAEMSPNRADPFNIEASHAEALQDSVAKLAERLGLTEDTLKQAIAKLQPSVGDIRTFRMEYSDHKFALILFVGQSDDDSLLGFYAIEQEYPSRFGQPSEATRLRPRLSPPFQNSAMEHLVKSSGSREAGWNSLLRLGFKMDWNEGKSERNLPWESHVVEARDRVLWDLTTYWGVIEPDIFSLLRYMRRKKDPVEAAVFFGFDYEPAHENFLVAQNKHTLTMAADVFNQKMKGYHDTPYPLQRLFSFSAALEEANAVRSVKFSTSNLFMTMDEDNYLLLKKSLHQIRKFTAEKLTNHPQFRGIQSGEARLEFGIASPYWPVINPQSPHFAKIMDAIAKQDLEAFEKELTLQKQTHNEALRLARAKEEAAEEFRRSLEPWPGFETLYYRKGEVGVYATTYQGTIEKVYIYDVDGFGALKGDTFNPGLAFTPDSTSELIRFYENWLSSSNPPDAPSALKIRKALAVERRAYSLTGTGPETVTPPRQATPTRSTTPYLLDVRGNRVPIADDPTGPYRGN